MKQYDRICVGTSMIQVLEAVYRSRLGERVLMIDRQSEMGGAWTSLRLFGLTDIENAIHYLLPDAKSFGFMKDVLGWDVIEVGDKHRVLSFPRIGYVTVMFDNPFGRWHTRAHEAGGFSAVLGCTWEALKETVAPVRRRSAYVRGGTPEMLRKVKAFLDSSEVEVKYSTEITGLSFDTAAGAVTVSTSAGVFTGKTLQISHGSRIAALVNRTHPELGLVEKVYPRPAAHLLVKDPAAPGISEWIFSADDLIKYAHDVSKYVADPAKLEGRRLIVLALLPAHAADEAACREAFKRLQRAGMLSPSAVLEQFDGRQTFLPPLENPDFAALKTAFGPLVSTLSTENFSEGVGLRADDWARKLSPAGRKKGVLK